MLLPATHLVSPLLANSALAIASRSRVRVLWRVLVSEVAMRLSEVRAHGQAFVENSLLTVEKFLERAYLLCSGSYGVRLEAGNLREQSHRVRDPLDGHEPAIPSISLLSGHAGPAAVVRLVIAVVIDAVKRIPGWARPHVLRKGWKTLPPSIAYGNPASAVVPVLGVGLEVATPTHIAPDAVKRMFVLERHDRIIGHAIKKDKE